MPAVRIMGITNRIPMVVKMMADASSHSIKFSLKYWRICAVLVMYFFSNEQEQSKWNHNPYQEQDKDI
jgi:hypothetical protein